MSAETTIDENKLKHACTSLKASMSQGQERLRECQKVCSLLMSIMRRGEDGTTNPIDERTGLPMSDATRLELYKAMMPAASLLLGWTKPPPEEEPAEVYPEESDG